MQNLVDPFIEATASVFSTMIGWDVVAGNPEHHLQDGECELRSLIGLSGQTSGVVMVQWTENVALKAAGALLGSEPTSVNADVVDTIGEITNMTVGSFKNTLCDLGFPCKLTLPAIVRGQNLSIAAIRSATRHVFHFECAGHRMAVDIQLKME